MMKIFTFIVFIGLIFNVNSIPTTNYKVNNSAGYQAASKLLLQGLDLTVDPCNDFYAFTCNTFLKNATIPPGASRIGTYDQSQELVNSQIAANVDNVNEKSSITEQIFKIGYNSCLMAFNNPNPTDLSNKINTQLLGKLNGLPMLNIEWTGLDWSTFWNTVGLFESNYGVGSLFSSYVSVDYEHHLTHALYINQGDLMLPRDFYIKNQFMSNIDNYVNNLILLVQEYNSNIGGFVNDDDIKNAVIETVQFEILLALSMLPDELLRNYHQQYNLYDEIKLNQAYPNINWDSYLQGLLKDVDPMYKQDHYVVTQPTYIGALDSMIGGNRVSQKVLANFVGLRLIVAYSDFISPQTRKISRNIKQFKHEQKVSKNNNKIIRFFDEDKQYCVDFMSTYMPYGSGFIYVKNINERDQVQKDVGRQTQLIIESFLNMTTTLKWIDQKSLDNVMNKNKQLVRNIGWPWWFSFSNTKYMDVTYHAHYHTLLSINASDFFDMTLALNKAYQQTENFGLLEVAPDRQNFGGPPSEVNAWYIPERNSITFPYAAFNPPYYRYDFPQAFNYAGQGGTAGHELTHGYDDEGVQFGPYGELSDCTWDSCSFLDKNSTLGFINMAQCVVSQYSEKCCPLSTGNVHCANGEHTQGENIADLGGQQAAYKAYRRYVAEDRHGVEEDRLPGLEQFTPNQIFWITYGYSWCMVQETANLVNQLLTNPHAPGSCRVNQVMQDIPEFGHDFKCKRPSPMYPKDNQRCHVWTDAPL